MSEAKMFKSAVDGWFLALIVVTAVLVLVVSIPVVQSASSAAAVMFIGASLIGVGFPIWILFSTWYRVEGDTLTARCGPFTWTLPVSSITGLEPSNSPLSSPALSLNRLEIRCSDGRSLLVSPADEAGFRQAVDPAPA